MWPFSCALITNSVTPYCDLGILAHTIVTNSRESPDNTTSPSHSYLTKQTEDWAYAPNTSRASPHVRDSGRRCWHMGQCSGPGRSSLGNSEIAMCSWTPPSQGGWTSSQKSGASHCQTSCCPNPAQLFSTGATILKPHRRKTTIDAEPRF